MRRDDLRLIIRTLTFLVFIFFLQSSLYAHVEQPKDEQNIGMDEKLGQYAPLDSIFNDENGNAVSLRQLIHTSTILAPVYYHCPDVCSLLLYNLARVLNQLSSEPGKEFQVVAVSFDEMEKPDLALQRKKMYLKMIEKPFPEDAWRFLTGDKENI
jgi:protein SCO1/2